MIKFFSPLPLIRGLAWNETRVKGPKGSLLLLILLVPACTSVPREGNSVRETVFQRELFDSETPIRKHWRHLRLRGETEYRLVEMEGRSAIRAVGRGSASGLFRRVSVDPTECTVLEWSWRVDELQKDADIRIKDREDVAAALYLLFGDPGSVFKPTLVPTLRYVWTNKKVPIEAVVHSPSRPETIRTIVVESGKENSGKWITERRNLIKDFEKAFGYPPQDRIYAIVLFTDNDQTNQPVKAFYAGARVICGSALFQEGRYNGTRGNI